jgi:hypothetical protein
MNQGFKELASVCAAISAGKQAILLRKAGLRESTAESCFQASSFFLLPTHYHEKKSSAPGDGFAVALRVEVIRAGDLRDWSILEKLAPLTAYDPKVLREHFESRDEKLLHFALVRAFRLQPVWHLPSSPELSGCRSWFELPAAPAAIQESPVPADAVLTATQALLP